MHTVYLGLGSNLSPRHATMRAAIDALAALGTVDAVSSFIETEPWGYQSPHPYLNAAVRLLTDLQPLELLDATQHIERTLGRTVKTGADGVYHDRPIDIDLLMYDSLHMQHPRLTLPHPLMQQRDFVMKTLDEIKPPPTPPP